VQDGYPRECYGTLIVDTIGIGLAAAGYLNPLLAAFIHVASELTFVLNSTRLLPSKERRQESSHEVNSYPA
jgi:cation transport ATPase